MNNLNEKQSTPKITKTFAMNNFKVHINGCAPNKKWSAHAYTGGENSFLLGTGLGPTPQIALENAIKGNFE